MCADERSIQRHLATVHDPKLFHCRCGFSQPQPRWDLFKKHLAGICNPSNAADYRCCCNKTFENLDKFLEHYPHTDMRKRGRPRKMR